MNVNGIFTINTNNSTYAFIVRFNVPVHLYYGERVDSFKDVEAYFPTDHRSFGIYFKEYGKAYYPSIFLQEVSFIGYVVSRYKTVQHRHEIGNFD